MLDKSIKETIILELKKIYFKSELLTSIDNIELETRTDAEKKTNDINIEKTIKNIIEKRNELNKIIETQHKKVIRTSESFAMIAALMTSIASGFTFIGKEKYDNISKPLYDFLQKNDFYIAITLSAVTAVLATLVLAIVKKIYKK